MDEGSRKLRKWHFKWHFKYFFVNLVLLRTIMLLYFNRAPFMLAYCPIDDFMFTCL